MSKFTQDQVSMVHVIFCILYLCYILCLLLSFNTISYFKFTFVRLYPVSLECSSIIQVFVPKANNR